MAVSAVGAMNANNNVPNNNAQNLNNAYPNVGTINEWTSRIKQMTDANNAYSAQQAVEQRNWQEAQNQKAMDFNANEAAKNRDWQQWMSDTSHQREIADLRAAGLNPILSANSGASTPSGSAASGVTSSGAKGDTDTSGSAALVNILGNIIDNQTKMEAQRMSAQNNLAVAERNAQSAQLVANIHGKYGLDAARISASSASAIAQMQAANAWNMNQANLLWQYEKLSSEQAFQEYLEKTYPKGFWSTLAAATQNGTAGIVGNTLLKGAKTIGNELVVTPWKAFGNYLATTGKNMYYGVKEAFNKLAGRK